MTEANLLKEAIGCFKTLGVEQQQIAVRFLKFLQSENKPSVKEVIEPLAIPRPQEETVIAGIKRLRNTYPMLEADSLMNVVSTLMNAHLIKGKSASSVIDELEIIFKQKYQEITGPNA